MKTCPSCNRTYMDDTLIFCLDDGTPLMGAPVDPQATQRIPGAPQTDPNASTEMYYGQSSTQPPPVVSVPQMQYGAWAPPPQPQQGGGKRWLVFALIGVVLFLVVGAGIVLIFIGAMVRRSKSTTASYNYNSSSYNSYSPSKPTPSETPTATRLGLTGSWSGLQNGNASSLYIIAGQGNAFSGTKYSGNYQISFVGTIDPVTRQVSINETKVLKGASYSNGTGWSLGADSGTLSSDGRSMSGTGKDQYNPTTPYSWSYTKK